MTTPTLDTYVARARAILALKSSIGTDVTEGADMAVTPGYEVYILRGSNERSGGRQYVGMAALGIRVYHTIVHDATKEAPIRTARKAAQADALGFVDWLMAHDLLRLNSTGGVNTTALVTATGDIGLSFGLMPYNSSVYYGFDLELPIEFFRG